MKKKYLMPIIIAFTLPTLVGCKNTEVYYTVQFKTYCDTELLPIHVKKGSLIEKPEELTRSCYAFVGWFNHKKEWNFETDVVMEDMTLKADWERIEYFVEYKYNDDSYKDLVTPINEGERTLGTTTLLTAYDNYDDYSALKTIEYEGDNFWTGGIERATIYNEDYGYGIKDDDIVVTLNCGQYEMVFKDYVDSNGNVVLTRKEYREHPERNGYERTEYTYNESNQLIKKIEYYGNSFKSGIKYSYGDGYVIEESYSSSSLTSREYYLKTYFDEDGNKTKVDYLVDRLGSEIKTMDYETTTDEDGNITSEKSIKIDDEKVKLFTTTYTYENGLKSSGTQDVIKTSSEGEETYQNTITYQAKNNHIWNEQCTSDDYYDNYHIYYRWSEDFLYKKESYIAGENSKDYYYAPGIDESEYYVVKQYDSYLKKYDAWAKHRRVSIDTLEQ